MSESEYDQEENEINYESISALDLIIEHKAILERDIWSLNYKIDERKELLEKMNQYIQNNCEHEYTIDYIDSMKNYSKGSQKIIYCKKCELVKPIKPMTLHTLNSKGD